MVSKTPLAVYPSGQKVYDVDGHAYTITWSDDLMSADVTDDDGRLCLVYAVKRGGHTVWMTTESPDAHTTPIKAIVSVTAELRRQRGAVPSAVQASPAAKPKQSWRDLMAKTPEKQPMRYRKDYDG